jgi:lysyl-tRNA synthetase class II
MAELSELERQRHLKLQRIREKGIDPYPPRIERTHTMAQAQAAFEEAPEGEALTVKVVGRLMSIRVMGRSAFAHIEDGSGRIQIYLRQNVVGEEEYEFFKRDFDIGDFVGVEGRLFRTRTGEVTVEVQCFSMLAKSLKPLYGGAMARPFTTYHNQLHQNLYLRIAVELYLKRLIVGGYERVYEIGKDFRNEGVDQQHNPEFTMIEFYMAYADYNDVMDLTEEMVAYVAQEVLGTLQITYDGNEIDLTPPWSRIPLRQAIREKTGIDYREYPDAESLYHAICEIGGNVEPKATWGNLVDSLLNNYVQPKLIQPTFLMDYPIEISPLAKKRPDDPSTVERFEGFIGGMEVCNAFTELNDPMDQRERFLAQGRAFEAGDEEAHQMDEDFIRAQSYGMPPTGGWGMGVDRLVMLFTDQASIRDVILFPLLRAKE